MLTDPITIDLQPPMPTHSSPQPITWPTQELFLSLRELCFARLTTFTYYGMYSADLDKSYLSTMGLVPKVIRQKLLQYSPGHICSHCAFPPDLNLSLWQVYANWTDTMAPRLLYCCCYDVVGYHNPVPWRKPQRQAMTPMSYITGGYPHKSSVVLILYLRIYHVPSSYRRL